MRRKLVVIVPLKISSNPHNTYLTKADCKIFFYFLKTCSLQLLHPRSECQNHQSLFMKKNVGSGADL